MTPERLSFNAPATRERIRRLLDQLHVDQRSQVPDVGCGQGAMARKALVEKAKREPKFSTRKVSRCHRCGRPRAYLRKFGLCRICFREMALNGELPGVRKASL